MSEVDTEAVHAVDESKPETKSGGDDVGEQSKANEIVQMEIQSAPTFVGLGKEDLLVLASRPFWVRLRWALFISFWLMWLGLLVGAALIIGLSPGCDSLTQEELKTTGYLNTKFW